MDSYQDIFTIGNFIVGLIIWNVIVAAGIALAGLLSLAFSAKLQQRIAGRDPPVP